MMQEPNISVEHVYLFDYDASLKYSDAVFEKDGMLPFDDNGAEVGGSVFALTEDDASMYTVNPEDYGARRVRAIVVRGECSDDVSLHQILQRIIDTMWDLRMRLRYCVSFSEATTIIVVDDK